MQDQRKLQFKNGSTRFTFNNDSINITGREYTVRYREREMSLCIFCFRFELNNSIFSQQINRYLDCFSVVLLEMKGHNIYSI